MEFQFCNSKIEMNTDVCLFVNLFPAFCMRPVQWMVPVWQDESSQNFLQRGDAQPIFMQKFFQVLQTHQCCPRKKQQTNQWEKHRKNDSFNIKADTQKKTNNIKQKLKGIFWHLTHLPIKLSMYSRHIKKKHVWVVISNMFLFSPLFGEDSQFD